MNVCIIDYSPAALAIVGDTYQIKDKLYEIGARYNPALTVGKGWVLSKNKAIVLNRLLCNLGLPSFTDMAIPQKVCKPDSPKVPKQRKQNPFIGVAKEVIPYLKNEPESFEMAVLQYFLGGGKVQTAQFKKALGYKSNKDYQPFFGLHSNDGQQLDTMPEAIGWQWKYDAAMPTDVINDVIEVMTNYPGKKAMGERLKSLYDSLIELPDYQQAFGNDYEYANCETL